MPDPEIMRKHARGDCIARAHDRISDIVPCGLDYQQRARLTDVLAQVWDNGCGYGQEPKGTACPRCEGCGQLAGTDDREPWTAWMSLPLRSSMAVLLGAVKPVPCDECGGTGKVDG